MEDGETTMNRSTFERHLAAAQQSYRTIRYRGPALDPARAAPPPWRFRLRWRPALALATVVIAAGAAWLVARGPEHAPTAIAAPPAFTSPLATLGSARRVIAEIPAPTPRPADGFRADSPRELFRLPTPPRRPGGFGEPTDSA